MGKVPVPGQENMNGDTSPPTGLWAELTKGQRRVLRQFLAKKNDKEIALALRLKEQTIHNYLASIQKRLGVDSRKDIAIVILSTPREENSKDG